MTTGTKPSKPGRPAALKKGANGADGTKSTFVISGLVDITAEGGKGGISHDGVVLDVEMDVQVQTLEMVKIPVMVM